MGYKDRKRIDELTISKEVAEEQLAILLNYYDIYRDELGTQGEKDLYDLSCPKLITAIRTAKLTFSLDPDGKLISEQIVEMNGKSQAINYEIISGDSKVQDSDLDDPQDSMTVIRSKRIYSLMGSLSGLGALAMYKFKKNDLSTMECLGFLLINL